MRIIPNITHHSIKVYKLTQNTTVMETNPANCSNEGREVDPEVGNVGRSST